MRTKVTVTPFIAIEQFGRGKSFMHSRASGLISFGVAEKQRVNLTTT